MKRYCKTIHIPASDSVCANCARFIGHYINDGTGTAIATQYGQCCCSKDSVCKVTGNCNHYMPESNIGTRIPISKEA